MCNGVIKLHAKFHRASLIKKRSNRRHMPNTHPGIHAQFHRASLIRKRFKIGGTKSLTMKQRMLFLEQFWHILKSRESLSFSNFEMRFSTTHAVESVIHSGKELLH